MSLTSSVNTKKGGLRLKRWCARFYPGLVIARYARKCFERGDREKALSLYKISSKLPLGAGWPLVKMADLIKDPKRKLELFRRAIRIDDHIWAYIGTTKIFMNQNRLAEAELVLNNLKKALPKTVWNNCPSTLQEVAKIENRLNYEKEVFTASLPRKNSQPAKNPFSFKINSRLKIIYVKPTQGLGNRLLLLDSIYAFAELNQFDKIRICWAKSNGFSEEKFEDLFELENLPPNISFIDETTYEKLAHNRTKLEKHFHQDKESLDYIFNTDKEVLLSLISESSFFYESWASLDWVFGIDLPKRYELLKHHIRPSQKIKEIIDSLNIDHSILGLHIRKGDAHNSPWASFFKESKDGTFHSVAENSKCRVFLSTDSARTQKDFIEKYKSKIIINDQKRFVDENLTENDPKDFQSDAAIDLFCLSQTRKFFGTHWSTFSQVANIIGSNQMEIISDDSPASFSVPNLSAIVGIKNRAPILTSSIQSWLIKPEIKEIIIVDCSSDDLDPQFFEAIDRRIKVIRLNNRKHFNLSEVYNVAIQHCTYDNIIKLDVDYILNPYIDLWDWLTINWETQFLTGDWKLQDLDNSLGFLGYLNGFLCVKKQHLIEAGCYQGNQYGYGYDDCDLYLRLEKLGLKRKIITFDKNYIPIIHTPHGDYHRTAFYEEKDWKESCEKNRLALENNVGGGNVVFDKKRGIRPLLNPAHS